MSLNAIVALFCLPDLNKHGSALFFKLLKGLIHSGYFGIKADHIFFKVIKIAFLPVDFAPDFKFSLLFFCYFIIFPGQPYFYILNSRIQFIKP